MNIDKISKHFKVNRRLEPEEVLDVIMGEVEQPKTKQELLNEKFDEVVALNNLEDQFAGNLELYRNSRTLFDAYISSPIVQTAIDSGYLQELNHTPELTVEEYKSAHDAKVDEPILEYIRDYINVDKLRVH